MLTNKPDEVNTDKLADQGWKRYEVTDTCPGCGKEVVRKLFEARTASGHIQAKMLEIWYDPKDKQTMEDGLLELAVARGTAVMIEHLPKADPEPEPIVSNSPV